MFVTDKYPVTFMLLFVPDFMRLSLIARFLRTAPFLNMELYGGVWYTVYVIEDDKSAV